MHSSFADLLVNAAVSGAVGVSAWVLVNFFAEPLLNFSRRRRAVRESLIYNANVGGVSAEATVIAARAELRRHAAALDALWNTAPRTVKLWLHFRGYDLAKASNGLMGFSTNLQSGDGSRALNRNDIEIGMKFSRTYSDEEIEGMGRIISTTQRGN